MSPRLLNSQVPPLHSCRSELATAACAGEAAMRVLPASWSSSTTTSSSSSSSSSSTKELNPRAAASDAAAGEIGARRTELYLNVYDISPVNHYLYWFGLGVFHSGIEVHGMEYGFGAHEYPISGVFEVEPKSCTGFIFRRSMCIGTTDMCRSEIRNFIEDLAGDYHGDTYHLIVKNCNHFTADFCKRLTGKPIPGWVNRLARLGSFCNCMLPESIKVSAVRDVTAHPEFSDDGLDSNASIVDESDVDDLGHLLTTPNSDIPPSKDKTLAPARDSF